MQALDELVARWRKNPDPESTLALCAHLGTSHQSELLREVGNTAEAWHRDNHSVMLSVGRMYLDAGLLAEAQAAFVQVGKLAPAETEPYRYLGEVLLRRGDAVRSEKALARAIKFGDADPKTRLWHERSVVYSALQQRKGLRAVAEEVARTAPQKASTPAPTLTPFEPAPSGEARAARRSRPPLTPARPSRPLRSSPPGASRRRPSAVPSVPPAGSSKAEPLETLMMGRSLVPVPQLAAPVHPPSPFFPSDSHSPGPRPRPNTAGNGVKPPKPSARQAPPLFPPTTTNASTHPPDSTAIPSDPFRGTFGDEAVVTVPKLPPALMFPPDLAPLSEPEPPPQTSRGTGPELANGWLPTAVDPSDELIPSPETVLLTLARVGLYETDSGVVPAWEATRQATPRRTWLMAGAVLLTIGMGFGGYRHAVQVQGQRLTRAQELSTRLAGLLDSGSRADLRASEADFQQLFELDSRGQEPALLWLKNRALYTLLDSDPVSGIESAMQRARTVGIEEQRLVFGRLASALAAGDLPGAGQIISEWDGRAKSDAMYQLLAGAIFERAGNPEALERFTSATLLQPDLKLAHLMAARLAMLQVGPTGAKAQLELAYSRLGPGPATQVLRGLEWAASPVSDPPIAPPPVADSLDDLPPLLHATASAVQAVREQREGRLEEATEAFKRALGPTTAPAMAAWIGYQALEAGDIEIARAAALKAMQLSALHKNAQALAARIALSDGRLQAAQEAVRGLEPSSRDAVLIEAVSAYENLQGTNVERLVSGLPLDPTGVRGLKALHESANVILGQSRAKGEAVEQLAAEAQVWGALIAIDLALDQGQLEFADGLIQARGWDGQVAAHGARLMRLRRYQGQLGAALELVAPLLDANETTPRMSAEVILSFVDAGRAAAAASSLGQVGAAAGPLTPWLEALVEAARGRQPSAVQSLKSLDLPSKADPLLVQVVALRALALSNDRRARGYFAQLAKRFPAQPDVQAAGKQLGLVR